MRLFVIVGALVIAACGGHDPGDIDEVVGATCASDRECEVRCYLGGAFPDGFCSLPCESDNECPVDTHCMSESGGVCMFTCPELNCDRLGPGWECRDKSRKNGGNISVCSGR